jgi:hypothetical protein
MHPVQHRTHGIPQAPDSWVLAFYLNTAQCVEPLSGHVQDAVLWISSWSWTRQSSRMQWHLHAWLKAVPCLIFVAKGEKSESLSSQPRARTRSASKATDARRSGPALNVLFMTWKLSRHDGDAPPVRPATQYTNHWRLYESGRQWSRRHVWSRRWLQASWNWMQKA